MLISIILLVYNRPRLTQQTLDSLWESLRSTSFNYEVICVDNGSGFETQRLLNQYQFHHHLRIHPNCGVGKGKNMGVAASQGTHLYISDNDIYFQSHWLETLMQTAQVYPEAKLIGAFRHPFHGLKEQYSRQGVLFERSDQQVGSSWFLTRETWEKYGPLSENQPIGIDDSLFCAKVIESGHWLGSIYPYKALHRGLKNSDGEWSPGGKDRSHETLPKGILFE